MKLEERFAVWCQAATMKIASSSKDLAECLVLTPDGFPVATSKGQELLDDPQTLRLATITASLHAVSHAIATEAGIGPQRHVVIDADGGKLVACEFQLGQHHLVLAMLGKPGALTGSIFVHAKNFSLQASQVAIEPAALQQGATSKLISLSND